MVKFASTLRRRQLKMADHTSGKLLVHLKSGKEKSLLRKHPWIFSGAIQAVEGNQAPGETVEVFSSKGEFLARGAYSPQSRIPVKVWTFREDEPVDESFFEKKIEQAMLLRKKIFSGKLPDAYRLVYAESDELPGLIVDLYGPYAVCQFTSSGTDRFKELISAILLRYAPEGVYERSDVDSRLKDGLELRTGLLCGKSFPDALPFMENGIRFTCRPKDGHKTGFYLDQRINRRLLMESAAGAEEVLNCFSYTGGFGLAALKGGARSVLNVDTSASALEIAAEQASMNGFSPDQFKTLQADVFQYLRSCRDSRKTFDLIILDPPKFAENFVHRERAARGYKDINLLAMKLLRPGGKLFTFSCSGAMDRDLFGKVVDSAAADAKVNFRITGYLSQGPDHPVSSAFPEGLYLKGISGIAL